MNMSGFISRLVIRFCFSSIDFRVIKYGWLKYFCFLYEESSVWRPHHLTESFLIMIITNNQTHNMQFDKTSNQKTKHTIVGPLGDLILKSICLEDNCMILFRMKETDKMD